MFGVLTLECIGWRTGVGRGFAAALADDFNRKVRRPWCARIVGLYSTGSFCYDFLRGQIDYRNSNGAGSRGVTMTFYPEAGGVYKAHYFTSWRSSADRFFRVADDGAIVDMTEEEARRWAIREDWAKTCATPQRRA